jgi:hypothetical protein
LQNNYTFLVYVNPNEKTSDGYRLEEEKEASKNTGATIK